MQEDKVWSVLLRKVKGQGLVINGIRLIKNKVSYSVDLVFAVRVSSDRNSVCSVFFS